MTALIPDSPGILAYNRTPIEIESPEQQEYENIRYNLTESSVLSPRMKPGLGVDLEKFYRILNHKYQTYVGPGHWFDMDRCFMRLGYAWPTQHDLEAGLACISQALQEAMSE